MPNTQSDVFAEKIQNHDTWNTCPFCKRSWKDTTPTPGLIHRTKRCKDCYANDEENRH